ncbi:MAG: NAD(P)H-hydrate dehydratase [Phycisphaerales bacterium]|nr:NAD(P)H-hydrate dehydratase [Phycisphaerales bacterium]
MSTPDTSPVPRLPERDPRGHKGTFGTVAIVGGCARRESPMLGAPVLAARAAFRAGCGLVRLVTPEPIITAALSLIPSATGVGMSTDEDGSPVVNHAVMEALRAADAIVVGPGLDADHAKRHPIADIVRQAVEIGIPTVIDADGLNALVTGEMLHRIDLSRCVLTPHPGEYERLATARGIGADATDEDERPEAAALLARSLGCVVVLKGAGTVVSDGERAWVCEHGHACLATAGTGDVLAGLTGSLVAQHRRAGLSLYDLARIAVSAQAIAGERWAQDKQAHAGLLASELADGLPGVLAGLTAGGASPSRRA